MPKDQLLSRLPCNAAWFMSNLNAFKWHVDTSTMGLVFAFCLNTVKGGELQVMMPKETMEIHMKEGLCWVAFGHNVRMPINLLHQGKSDTLSQFVWTNTSQTASTGHCMTSKSAMKR